ncbi:hypothetical protein KIPB_009324, partial [Kipferlia bialata]
RLHDAQQTINGMNTVYKAQMDALQAELNTLKEAQTSGGQGTRRAIQRLEFNNQQLEAKIAQYEAQAEAYRRDLANIVSREEYEALRLENQKLKERPIGGERMRLQVTDLQDQLNDRDIQIQRLRAQVKARTDELAAFTAGEDVVAIDWESEINGDAVLSLESDCVTFDDWVSLHEYVDRPEAEERLRSISTLNLVDTALMDGSLAIIVAGVLPRMPSVMELNLSNNCLTPECLTVELAKACKDMRVLDLSDNDGLVTGNRSAQSLFTVQLIRASSEEGTREALPSLILPGLEPETYEALKGLITRHPQMAAMWEHCVTHNPVEWAPMQDVDLSASLAMSEEDKTAAGMLVAFSGLPIILSW